MSTDAQSTAEAPDRNLAMELVRVTEAAAMAAGRWVGRGDKLGGDGADDATRLSFREEAHAATGVVMGELQEWGARAVHRRILSGSPAVEIVKAAKESGADLIVVASGSGGLSETILLGSTAQRVQHSAPCPVLVSRTKL